MSKHKREKFTAPLDKTRQDKPFVQVGGELTEEQHRGNCALEH